MTTYCLDTSHTDLGDKVCAALALKGYPYALVPLLPAVYPHSPCHGVLIYATSVKGHYHTAGEIIEEVVEAYQPRGRAALTEVQEVEVFTRFLRGER